MIIDTNVVVTASDPQPNAAPHCVIRCLEVLQATKSEIVALDSDGEILAEYTRNVPRRDYPLSVSAQFVRELYNTRHDPSRCELVPLTPNADRVYEEFPTDPRLAKFDRSDRKFVSVGLTSARSHAIYNAVDTDWAAVDDALVDLGVTVVYLCPSFTKPAHKP